MWPLPEVGTILWCRFPEKPRDLPGPKPRPVMVMAVSPKDRVVKVAYGTSQHLDHLFAGEFAIRQNQRNEFFASGLTTDTKFNLGHTLSLPYNTDYFEPVNNQNPEMGKVADSLFHVVEAAFIASQRI